MSSVPITTHLFLLALPLVIALASLLWFLLGRPRP